MISGLVRRLRYVLGIVFSRLVRWSPYFRGPAGWLVRRLGLGSLVFANGFARRLLLSPKEPRYAKVLDTRPCGVAENTSLELHMLTGECDVLRTVWALKSFYCYSGLDPGLFIHNDGTLTAESIDTLRHHFPGCRIPEEAAEQVQELLAGYPMCQFFRQKHIMSIKLLDALLCSQAEYLLVMDSDILWFSESPRITNSIRRGTPFHVESAGGAYARNRRFLEERCSLVPTDRFNAGIIGYRREEFLDLEFIEHALDKMVNVPPEFLPESLGYGAPRSGAARTDPVESITWWVMEQTLYALLFGRCDDVVRLGVKPSKGNKGHPFVNEPITSETALQHYISDSLWNAFFPVGVEYLLRNGFPRDWDARQRQ